MKAIFLDFDGVINRGSGRWVIELVERLNRITDTTGAKIIVHSSWRYGRSVDDLRLVLRGYHEGVGVTGEVYDACCVPAYKMIGPNVWVDDDVWAVFRGDIESNDERCIAIQRWLDEHPGMITRYIILDDNPKLGHFVGTPNFIQTALDVGLTDDQVEKAIRQLDRDNLDD